MARSLVATEILGLIDGQPKARLDHRGRRQLDPEHYGLAITDPVWGLEATLNQTPGVVGAGLFAHRPADVVVGLFTRWPADVVIVGGEPPLVLQRWPGGYRPGRRCHYRFWRCRSG